MVAVQTPTKQITKAERAELLKCALSPTYFINEYVWIYDAVAEAWIPFKLWQSQVGIIRVFMEFLLVIVLKARQVGLTWLALAWALWKMLFRSAATILIFSRRDDEAIDLLDYRLKGMHAHLPEWMRVQATADSKHDWVLANGSRAKALPTTGGDSYTASVVIVDEYDLIQDQKSLMNAVKPTIDNGGQMIVISRSNKKLPQSLFKKTYRAAKAGLTNWVPIFLPWHARPDRSEAWFEEQKRDILSRTQSLDDLHEQYPATDTEALAPRTLDKRIAPLWLEQCYVEQGPLTALPQEAPSIPGLEIFRLPEPRHHYVIGADPAEGNPTSDDSALAVLDRETGEEVATLAGKFQPSTLAGHAHMIGNYFNQADVMVERNNHGHAVILWLDGNSNLSVLDGFDNKPGWHSTTSGKVRLYDATADAFRNEETILHSFMTYTQLQSIEGATLRAPDNELDDRADAYALALVGRLKRHEKVWIY